MAVPRLFSFLGSSAALELDGLLRIQHIYVLPVTASASGHVKSLAVTIRDRHPPMARVLLSAGGH